MSSGKIILIAMPIILFLVSFFVVDMSMMNSFLVSALLTLGLGMFLSGSI